MLFLPDLDIKTSIFCWIISTTAKDAVITTLSNTVGNINDIDIIIDEFQYYTDNIIKTLQLYPVVLEIEIFL